MKLSVLLVCCFHLVLKTQGGVVTQSECPSLDAVKLAKLKSLVVKDDVNNQLVGTFSDLWGSKVLFDEDPDTCIKYSRQSVNGTEFAQSVHTKGKWFGGVQTRNSTLEKVENGVYLEVLHNVPTIGDFVLAKVYVLYAKNNVFAYFWCMMYTPPADKKEASLPSLSGVAVPTQDPGNPLAPEAQTAVEEAVHKVQDNKDILGEIVNFSSSC